MSQPQAGSCARLGTGYVHSFGVLDSLRHSGGALVCQYPKNGPDPKLPWLLPGNSTSKSKLTPKTLKLKLSHQLHQC